MKVQKLQKILTYAGFAGILLAFILLNIAPLVEDGGFEFVGIQAFGLGIASLFSFNFASAPVVLLFFLFLIALIGLGSWLFVILNTKDEKEGKPNKKIITVVLAFVAIFMAFSIYSAVFAAQVPFNGAESIVYDGMNKVSGHGFGKFLTMFSVALSHVTVMCFTLLSFIDFEDYVKKNEKPQAGGENK